MDKDKRDYIKSVITTCLREKFQNYVPKDNVMPFHWRLLGRDRMELYSFIQSLLTTFGTSIFEPVAAALAKEKFTHVETQYIVGSDIYSDCQHCIQTIVNELTISAKPNKSEELKRLRASLSGKKNKLKPIRADLFVETSSREKYLFDLKTAKPNKGDFQKFKQTLLEWAGIVYTRDNSARVHTLIAIPYNPYEPNPYQFWTMAGMLDRKEDFAVADEFWDFLGGTGSYNELLDCFEQAGIEMRDEIDTYFARFK